MNIKILNYKILTEEEQQIKIHEIEEQKHKKIIGIVLRGENLYCIYEITKDSEGYEYVKYSYNNEKICKAFIKTDYADYFTSKADIIHLSDIKILP